jgi:hypothetical protein
LIVFGQKAFPNGLDNNLRFRHTDNPTTIIIKPLTSVCPIALVALWDNIVRCKGFMGVHVPYLQFCDNPRVAPVLLPLL